MYETLDSGATATSVQHLENSQPNQIDHQEVPSSSGLVRTPNTLRAPAQWQTAPGPNSISPRYLVPDAKPSARWASPDGRDNSVPRIISESFYEQHANRNEAILKGGGEVVQQLSVACDPDAWELNEDELQFNNVNGK